MGNHYGTVRCSVCYERGHNKRSCPEFTARLERQLVTQQARVAEHTAGSPMAERAQARVDHYAEIIGKRTGTNPLTKATITKRGMEAFGLPHVHDGSVELRFGTDGWGPSGTAVGTWDATSTDGPAHKPTIISPVDAESINPPEGWDNGESSALVDHFNMQKA
jgi:hypothetical protein